MAVTVTRKVIPQLKIEQAILRDQYGAEHIIQQSIMPLAQASEADLPMLRDWHEAIIQMETEFHQRREDAVTRACKLLEGK